LLSSVVLPSSLRLPTKEFISPFSFQRLETHHFLSLIETITAFLPPKNRGGMVQFMVQLLSRGIFVLFPKKAVLLVPEPIPRRHRDFADTYQQKVLADT